MEMTKLLLTICLCTPCVIKSDSPSWKQQEQHSCYYNSKCYNPYWCEAVLSKRECSNQNLHRKLECLTDMLNERSEACQMLNLSSEAIDILTKNLSMTVEDLSKEQAELKNSCTSTMNSLQQQQEQVNTWNEKVDSMNKASEELQVKCVSLDTEMDKLNRGIQNTDKVVESLKSDTESVKNRLATMDSIIQSKQKQIEALSKEQIELKNACASTQNILSEFQKQQEQVSTWTKKVDSVKKESEEIQVKCKSLDTELDELNRGKQNTDKVVESLKSDTESIKNRLASMDSRIQWNQKQVNEQLHEIATQSDNNIQNSEQRLQEQFREELRHIDDKVKSLEYNLTASEDKFNITFMSLNETIAYNKENSSRNLHKLSEEMQAGFENFFSTTGGLKSAIKDLESKLEKDTEEKTEQILHESKQEISEEINSRMSVMAGTIDIKMEKINSFSKQVSNSLTETEKMLDFKINKETNVLRTEINLMVAKLETSLNTLTDNSKTKNENINMKILEMGNLVKKFKDESDQDIEDTKKALTKMVEENISSIDSKVDSSLDEMNKNVEELKREIRQLIKNEVEQLSQQTIEVNQTVTKQKEIVDVIYPNTFNKEMFIMAFLLLVVLLAINYAIVYTLMKRTSPSQPLARTQTTDSVPSKTHIGEEPHSPVEVYNRLTFQSLPADNSSPLRDSIAVISFYEDAQKHHRSLIKSVLDCLPGHHDVTVDYHIVRRHEHIPGIPRAKLCIMFVEFSERHVIIEEPGLGLGDLKRKTAKYINTIGACHVIVYVRDPGSKHLKSSELFNNTIHCARSQPELTALSDHGRFLSIYDKFTDSQTQRLVDIITANLGHTGSRKLHLKL